MKKRKGWIIGLSFLVILFALTATALVIDQLLNFYGRNRQFYTTDLPVNNKIYKSKLDSTPKLADLEESTVKAPDEVKENSPTKSEPEKVTLHKREQLPQKVKSIPSSITDEKFNTWGEYLSREERDYRAMVVNKLKIKTVVIDHLSPGNGVSQEFFKVAYRTKMIPPRILEELVESREFRELIPAKYLKRERALLDIKKGLYIKLDKKSLEMLLATWSRGELTPIQKAWAVGAEE